MGTFSKVIETCVVNNNHITKLCDLMCTSLNAEYNELKVLPKLPHCTHLNISHNPITEIDKTILNQLHELIANNCRLQSLGDMPNATFIDVSYNQLTCFKKNKMTRESFAYEDLKDSKDHKDHKDCKDVKDNVKDVKDCKSHKDGGQQIDTCQLPKCRTLRAERNNLVCLPNLPKCEALYVYRNQLTYIDPKQLPSCTELSCANNKLKNPLYANQFAKPISIVDYNNSYNSFICLRSFINGFSQPEDQQLYDELQSWPNRPETIFKSDTCVICLEDIYSKSVAIYDCGHMCCHYHCCVEKCPLCRKGKVAYKITVIYCKGLSPLVVLPNAPGGPGGPGGTTIGLSKIDGSKNMAD